MTHAEQGMADFLRSIGYYENESGFWTHRDLNGKWFSLVEAYEYEMEMFK